MLESPEFWVAVGFVIIVALMIGVRGARTFIADLIGSIGLDIRLDARAARIRSELDEARRLHEEAATALADQKRKAAAHDEALRRMAEQAAVEAARAGEKAAADLARALARREEQAQQRIAQAEAEAIAEIRNSAINLAMAASRRLLAEQAGGAGATRLVDAAIAELPSKLR
jgi:F-type H+-transporting ATPase subunit b